MLEVIKYKVKTYNTLSSETPHQNIVQEKKQGSALQLWNKSNDLSGYSPHNFSICNILCTAIFTIVT